MASAPELTGSRRWRQVTAPARHVAGRLVAEPPLRALDPLPSPVAVAAAHVADRFEPAPIPWAALGGAEPEAPLGEGIGQPARLPRAAPLGSGWARSAPAAEAAGAGGAERETPAAAVAEQRRSARGTTDSAPLDAATGPGEPGLRPPGQPEAVAASPRPPGRAVPPQALAGADRHGPGPRPAHAPTRSPSGPAGATTGPAAVVERWPAPRPLDAIDGTGARPTVDATGPASFGDRRGPDHGTPTPAPPPAPQPPRAPGALGDLVHRWHGHQPDVESSPVAAAVSTERTHPPAPVESGPTPPAHPTPRTGAAGVDSTALLEVFELLLDDALRRDAERHGLDWGLT